MTRIKAEPGESIHRLAQRVIAECNRTMHEHELEHNTIVVRVYPGSHEYDIYDKWDLKRRLEFGGR